MLKAWRRETREKTKEDIQLCEGFLKKEKNVRKEAHTIAPAELNKYLSGFIRSVRRTDGKRL